MKQFIAAIGLLVSMIVQSQELNVMTFNIRYDNKNDSLNAWPYRKDKAASQVLFHQTHLLGVQEALHDQVMDLSKSLSRFKYIGVGRDDGKTKGEYSAIFYDTTRLKLVQSATFWLSLTPEVPGSKGWDADITRVVTWAKFSDIKAKKLFYFFNTHFDHIGQEARRESAKLLKQRVRDVAGDLPVIITGDFNAKPSEEPIKVLMEDPNKFTDSKHISITPHYGPEGTFNGFGSRERDNEPIDHIFLKGKWKVLQHATLSQTWGGRFSSDHFPVYAKLSF